MEAPQRYSWEIQEGEPEEWYANFLLYRNLGPSRSLDKAYRSVSESNKDKEASGGWAAACAEWKWVKRAVQWDIHHLSQEGARAVLAFSSAVTVASVKSLQALTKHEPASWSEAIDALKALRGIISDEVIKAVELCRDIQVQEPIIAPVAPIARLPAP